MWTLYHLWLSPHCRGIRLMLAEKKIDFAMKVEKIWERREDFLKYNPACDVPVLVHEDGRAFADSRAIAEYIEAIHPTPKLFGETPEQGAEIRRLVNWFDVKFFKEVSHHLVNEKIMKRFLGLGTPNSNVIRAAKTNLEYHLEYIAYLAGRRNWLAGDDFSYADIAAAAHLSCLDYLDDIVWKKHAKTKDWYVRVKSRPTFRSILGDHIPGVPPPKHYANLDF